jgi:hypothetical protein
MPIIIKFIINLVRPLALGGGLVLEAAPGVARRRMGRMGTPGRRTRLRHRHHGNVPVTAVDGIQAPGKEMDMRRSRGRFHSDSHSNRSVSVETPTDGTHLPSALLQGVDHGRNHPEEQPGPQGRLAGRRADSDMAPEGDQQAGDLGTTTATTVFR